MESTEPSPPPAAVLSTIAAVPELPAPLWPALRAPGELAIPRDLSSLSLPSCTAVATVHHRRPPLAMVAAGQPVTIWSHSPPPLLLSSFSSPWCSSPRQIPAGGHEFVLNTPAAPLLTSADVSSSSFSFFRNYQKLWQTLKIHKF